MKTSDKIKMFTTLHHNLINDVEDYGDIKRLGLTMADYNISLDVLRDLSGIKNAKSETISQNVADLFRRRGFMVKEKGIGWQISFE